MVWPTLGSRTAKEQEQEQGQLVIARLILLVAKSCTKCEVSSFGRCIDILGGVKFYNVSRDPDHASFRDDVSPAGWDLLRLTYRPNLNF